MFSKLFPTRWITSSWSNPLRTLRTHVLDYDNTSRGRSVVVQNRSVALAYNRLREILNESNVRETVRYQQFFERKHDKKRRLKNERRFRQYLVFMEKNIQRSAQLRKQTLTEKSNYVPI